jgi:hypothetical protein
MMSATTAGRDVATSDEQCDAVHDLFAAHADLGGESIAADDAP